MDEIKKNIEWVGIKKTRKDSNKGGVDQRMLYM